MNYKTRQKQAKLQEICGKHVYPWFIDLGEKFKRFGGFQLCLSDYYKNPMDKQVAEIFSIIAPKNGREKYLTEFRNILGNSPWEKIKNRDFMEFTKEGLILGNPFFTHSLIFNVLDWLWEVSCEDKVPFEYVILGELGIIKRHHSTPLKNVFSVSDIKYRLEMVLVKLTLRDGFGAGIWHFLEEEDLPCPLSTELRKIMFVFYPIKMDMTKENESNIISFIGFEKKVNFLYSAWGYQYLRKKKPQETAKFEKKLKKWTNDLQLRYNMKIDVPTDCLDV